MNIAAAQIRPLKGNIQQNLAKHVRLIESAVAKKVDIIVFPELSTTGYEPGLAKDLATVKEDARFDIFQTISDQDNITICIGAPLTASSGIAISMIIFQPRKQRQVYAKQYLHVDEYPWFVNGHGHVILEINNTKIAPAICYELSVPQHPENAHRLGAGIYNASVAKTAAGVDKAITQLSEIANNYSMTVLLSNFIGNCDNTECGGRSSVWNDNGVLLGQLDDHSEGVLLIDTSTGKPGIEFL